MMMTMEQFDLNNEPQKNINQIKTKKKCQNANINANYDRFHCMNKEKKK